MLNCTFQSIWPDVECLKAVAKAHRTGVFIGGLAMHFLIPGCRFSKENFSYNDSKAKVRNSLLALDAMGYKNIFFVVISIGPTLRFSRKPRASV